MEDKLRINLEVKQPFSVEEASRVLSNQIQIEEYKDFRLIIEKISLAFNEAVETNDKEKIKECLNRLHMHYGYLAEKYRETSAERIYIKKVNESIEYLEELVK